jgi:hypothetical protein
VYKVVNTLIALKALRVFNVKAGMTKTYHVAVRFLDGTKQLYKVTEVNSWEAAVAELNVIKSKAVTLVSVKGY